MLLLQCRQRTFDFVQARCDDFARQVPSSIRTTHASLANSFDTAFANAVKDFLSSSPGPSDSSSTSVQSQNTGHSFKGRYFLYLMEAGGGFLLGLMLHKLLQKTVKITANALGIDVSGGDDVQTLERLLDQRESEHAEQLQIFESKPLNTSILNNYPGAGNENFNPNPPANIHICEHNWERNMKDTYKLYELLGRGSFAVVYRGVRKFDFDASELTLRKTNTNSTKGKNLKNGNRAKKLSTGLMAGNSVAIKIVRLDKETSAEIAEYTKILNKELAVLRRLDPNYHVNTPASCMPTFGATGSSFKAPKRCPVPHKHPGCHHVVHFYETFEGPYDGHHSLFIVKELCQGGELFDLITQRERLPERQVRPIMKQILLGIQYTHACGVSHRCPKPEDILLKWRLPEEPSSSMVFKSFREEGNKTLSPHLREHFPFDNVDFALSKGRLILQLTDFGMGATFDPLVAPSSSKGHHPDGRFTTRQGTPYYVAPEVITGHPFNRLCDLWSCGVITYILFAGYPPFIGDSDLEVLAKIKAVKFSFPEEDFGPEEVSETAKKFICALMTDDVTKRWDSGKCLEGEFLGGVSVKIDGTGLYDWGF